MFKNTASQKFTVIAFADAGHATLDAGEPVTGDAANITCKVEQDDDGTQSATNDVNPTEVEDGQYRFDLTQAETNGDKLTFYPESSTAGVQVVGLPSNVIYTRPANFSDSVIDANGRYDISLIEGTDATDQINAACDTAIETYYLHYFFHTTPNPANIVDNSVIPKMVSSQATADWDDFVNTTDSLQAIRDHIGDGTNLSEAGGTGDHLTALATAAALTTVDTVVDTINTNIGTPSNFGSGTSTIAANLEDIADNGTAAYDRSTDSLQALRDHVGDGTNLSEAGGTGDHLTAIPWNANWDTEVQSECNDALVALGLDHLVSVAVVGTDITDNSIIARFASKQPTADWDDFDNTTDSLQALRDRGDAAWITATSVTVSAGGITAASFGAGAIDDAAIAADAENAIADALLDRTDGVETDNTVREALRIIFAACAGKLSGAATTTVNIRDRADTKNRISATVDADGNRSAVTLDDT